MRDIDGWVALRDSDRPLPAAARSAEIEQLFALLADDDPRVRDDVALPIMTRWILRGDLDAILASVGDGLAEMLRHESVFARSFAALAIGSCIERDDAADVVGGDDVKAWTRQIVEWLLIETDARGIDARRGWAHAFAHGADALAAAASSRRLDTADLAWLLARFADILRRPDVAVWWHGEADRWALAIRAVHGRSIVDREEWRAWFRKLTAEPRQGDPYLGVANADATLRALALQLGETGPEEFARLARGALKDGSLRYYIA